MMVWNSEEWIVLLSKELGGSHADTRPGSHMRSFAGNFKGLVIELGGLSSSYVQSAAVHQESQGV